MKTCPVCKTQVFDDMQSCFGCMHRFDDEPGPADGALRPEERRWEIETRPASGRGDYETGLSERGALESVAIDGASSVMPREWKATPLGPQGGAPLSGNGADAAGGAGIGVRLEVRVATDPAQVWSAELYPTTWPPASSRS